METTIGTKTLIARRAKNLKQCEAAKILGMHLQTLIKLEKGRKPRLNEDQYQNILNFIKESQEKAA